MPHKPKPHDISFLRLGDILVEKGIINEEGLASALKKQKDTKKRLGALLVEMNLISESQLIEILAKQLGIEILTLSDDMLEIPEKIVNLITEEDASKHQIIPITFENFALKVAMIDPTDMRAVDFIKMTTGYKIKEVLISKGDFERLLTKYYTGERRNVELRKIIEDVSIGSIRIDGARDDQLDIDKLKEEMEGAPIVKLVNHTIINAVMDRASDIHIEPSENAVNIRYRIDGIMFKMQEYPKGIQMPFTSRLKILAGLDIAERRLPQDGRFNIAYNKDDVDIRVSTLPTIHGEKVVMRLLKKDMNIINLNNLGFDEADLKLLRRYINMPNGIILLTGPTGSGKSTTLYAALNEINSSEINIVTVEDPVEYRLDGIYQVHANAKIGLTFAAGLKSILRQDPDVIMVGEIRDLETAEMAIRSSLTGHLVFSTLHTIDAPSTIVRLSNMGIEPFLVVTSLRLAIAQRLLRKICPKCKEDFPMDKTVLKDMGIAERYIDMKLYHGAGCDHCKGSGYYGRHAVYEILEMTQEMRDVMLQERHLGKIREAAMANGMVSLRDKGIQKAFSGLTTLDEVLRVCIRED